MASLGTIRKRSSAPKYQSVTTSVPFMSRWPSPQNTLQKKLNSPDLPGVNSTTVFSPGFNCLLTPKSGSAKPCWTSMLSMVIFTGMPFFTVMVEGVNSQLCAVMRNSCTLGVPPVAIAVPWGVGELSDGVAVAPPVGPLEVHPNRSMPENTSKARTDSSLIINTPYYNQARIKPKHTFIVLV